MQVALADPDASAETLRSACEELLTLGAGQERLIESLLTLASSEQGVDEWEPLDLGAITAEVILVRQAEAPRRDVRDRRGARRGAGGRAIHDWSRAWSPI